MVSIYWVFALLGSGILLIQFVMTLLGADHDSSHDISTDLDHGDADFGHISFRTLTAFLAFFGVAGLAMNHGGAGTGMTLVVALGSGALAFYAVAFVMMKFHHLRSNGTVQIENTIGRNGRVYLVIPGGAAGVGKVTVAVQGRTMEFPAVTHGPELPTATACRVVALHTKDTVVVESA